MSYLKKLIQRVMTKDADTVDKSAECACIVANFAIDPTIRQFDVSNRETQPNGTMRIDFQATLRNGSQGDSGTLLIKNKSKASLPESSFSYKLNFPIDINNVRRLVVEGAEDNSSYKVSIFDVNANTTIGSINEKGQKIGMEDPIAEAVSLRLPQCAQLNF